MRGGRRCCTAWHASRQQGCGHRATRPTGSSPRRTTIARDRDSLEPVPALETRSIARRRTPHPSRRHESEARTGCAATKPALQQPQPHRCRSQPHFALAGLTEEELRASRQSRMVGARARSCPSPCSRAASAVVRILPRPQAGQVPPRLGRGGAQLVDGRVIESSTKRRGSPLRAREPSSLSCTLTRN